MLREIVPGFNRLAIMANADGPGAVLEMAEVMAAARTLGIETVTFEIGQAEDIALAFDSFKGRTEALYISNGSACFTNRIRINTWRRTCDCQPCTANGSMSKREVRILWSKHPRSFSALRRVCRQDIAWSEARRPTGRAADQVQSRHKPDHSQGAWSDNSADVLVRADEVIE